MATLFCHIHTAQSLLFVCLFVSKGVALFSCLYPALRHSRISLVHNLTCHDIVKKLKLRCWTAMPWQLDTWYFLAVLGPCTILPSFLLNAMHVRLYVPVFCTASDGKLYRVGWDPGTRGLWIYIWLTRRSIDFVSREYRVLSYPFLAFWSSLCKASFWSVSSSVSRCKRRLTADRRAFSSSCWERTTQWLQ